MQKIVEQAKSEEPVTLRLLIIDDHVLLIDTIRAVMRGNVDFEVDGAAHPIEAMEKIKNSGRYDVVLLDYHMPGVEGLSALRNLVQVNGGGIVLFSGVASWSIIENAMQQGASGFIPKTTPLKTMINAIRFVADGEVYLPFDYLRRTGSNINEELGLKPREVKVLSYLCEGMQNKEIGREVGIEEAIVKMDVKSICRKLGVRNRTEAALAARARGLF